MELKLNQVVKIKDFQEKKRKRVIVYNITRL